MTHTNNIDKIKEEGLKPMEASLGRRQWYPERIYLLTDKCDKIDINTYVRQLGTSYVVICDLSKMGKRYKFFKDPQSLESFSVFTDKPIPKKCIEIKMLKDLYK